LSILKRGTVDKNASPATAARPAMAAQRQPAQSGRKQSGSKKDDKTKDSASTKPNEKPAEKPAEKPVKRNEPLSTPATPHPAGPPPLIEDWWLVRDSHGRVGWVLGRMVDMDVPLDVAQYAEGQRIVAFFILNEVEDWDKDADKKIPQYLMVLTEPKDGLPFDFNQFRVFTWNVKRHRYETAYRERIEGMLPVTLAKEDFGKEGVLPVFMVRALQDDGTTTQRKYKLNTPIVRRVLAPNEVPAKPLRKEPRKTSAKKHRRGR
jgi:hypothetical protein